MTRPLQPGDLAVIYDRRHELRPAIIRVISMRDGHVTQIRFDEDVQGHRKDLPYDDSTFSRFVIKAI